jgi:NADPH-dependent 2,4-dienoyl-CoA reductase/sulfur reductase-like enzyme/peroxiredoxin family protein/TusA-related sulfurtransferase/rhodanese-related sulfurtransferase
MKVLIVGGVAGGATAAARLRRLDEHAEIILFERGEYISFANCGLPYYIGGEITDKADLTLQTPKGFYDRFRVDIRTQNEVIAIDPTAKVVDVKDLKSGEVYNESYDKLILAPGAAPIRPKFEGADLDRVFTLRNIPDTYRIKDFIDERKPRRALVVGGGYIGIEMAENLHRAGLEVTVVEFLDHVIAPLDFDMAAEVHNHIRQKGVSLMLETGVTGIYEDGEELRVSLRKKDAPIDEAKDVAADKIEDILTDMVILSVGVYPENALALQAGLATNARGAVITNEHQQTSNPDIYAVGDVTEIVDYITKDKGYIPLAGPANKQARIAADHICGISSPYKGTQGTGILRVFDLTVGTVGLTEARIKQLNIDYEKSYTWSASHASYYPGATNMTIKLLYKKEDGAILGAQIVGYDGVDKRIDVLATAIRANMTVYDLTELELAYAPPYSSAKDPVNMAGYVAENTLTGKVKFFHWDQVNDLPRDGSVTLLDIRAEESYKNGSIEGFINIPEEALRDSLGRLDPAKPVYVMCQIGLKGYSACRMLSQRGYNCYNLAGGYRLWSSIYRAPTYKEKAPAKKGNDSTMTPSDPSRLSTPPLPGIAESSVASIRLNTCGMQCPGPIMKVSEALADAQEGDIIEVKSSDPAFGADIEAWCRRTGNTFLGLSSEKGILTALIAKGCGEACIPQTAGTNKNIIVFSGDLDKAIAAFIIANASAAMGRKVSMFFTFWGLNILRKPEKVPVKKDFISSIFGKMMPRGAGKLSLSKMNMGGMGAKMIRSVMKNKNIDSLEDLIKASLENGVELVACSMSMDVMGLKMEELIDGVKMGGAAAMLANAEESDMSLFI